nr:MAG TPA: hypothetical protein [Caudoviricetes sp.]
MNNDAIRFLTYLSFLLNLITAIVSFPLFLGKG